MNGQRDHRQSAVKSQLRGNGGVMERYGMTAAETSAATRRYRRGRLRALRQAGLKLRHIYRNHCKYFHAVIPIAAITYLLVAC